uniref:Uncharacterized protein n=1 Tax=Knipowitschia caucasica TaxID=637954 RepID=A0AAV2LTZ5_KNICA
MGIRMNKMPLALHSQNCTLHQCRLICKILMALNSVRGWEATASKLELSQSNFTALLSAAHSHGHQCKVHVTGRWERRKGWGRVKKRYEEEEEEVEKLSDKSETREQEREKPCSRCLKQEAGETTEAALSLRHNEETGTMEALQRAGLHGAHQD